MCVIPYQFLKKCHFCFSVSIDIFPPVLRQPADSTVKSTIIHRCFNVHFYTSILFHFRVGNFSIIISGQVRVHHHRHAFLLYYST